jgi:hypothetical protein
MFLVRQDRGTVVHIVGRRWYDTDIHTIGHRVSPVENHAKYKELTVNDGHVSSGGHIPQARAPRIPMKTRLFAYAHFIRRADSSCATTTATCTNAYHQPERAIMC